MAWGELRRDARSCPVVAVPLLDDTQGTARPSLSRHYSSPDSNVADAQLLGFRGSVQGSG
jgi:hypothetical protein